MTLYPKIQNPCPYVDRFDAIMDGDHCSMCKRQVVDLDALDGSARAAFLAGCKDDVCVSYKASPAIAAAALAAAMVAMPSAAYAQTESGTAADDFMSGEIVLIMGGIKDPDMVEHVDPAADSDLPELPVVYDDAADDPAG